jgi:AraC family transcriptional regulator of arabinose operon
MDWAGIEIRIDWTRCTRRRWPPTARLGFSPQERRKTRNVLLYWWAGRGRRRLPSGDAPVHAGLCHWSRPGWTYECSQSPRNPLGVTVIHFDLIDAHGRVVPPEKADLPPEQLRVRNPRLAEEITRWIAERAMDVRAGIPLAAAVEQAAHAMLRGLLITLTHDTPADPLPAPAAPGWEHLTSFIQEHLHDLPDVSGLAEKAGYTRSHFSRLFKAQTGLSPQHYVINARVALSKELLRGTSLTIHEVAERAGYPDVFRFFRQFRERTGTTPTRYRLDRRDRGGD